MCNSLEIYLTVWGGWGTKCISMCAMLRISSEKQVAVWKLWIEVKSWRISASVPVKSRYFVQTAKHFSILFTFGELFGMQVRQKSAWRITYLLRRKRNRNEHFSPIHSIYFIEEGVVWWMKCYALAILWLHSASLLQETTKNNLYFFYGNECWWDKIWCNHKHSFSKKCPHGTNDYNSSDYLEGWVHLPSDTLALSNGFKLIRSVRKFPAKLVNSFLTVKLFGFYIYIF